jgi:hypothetical protein
MSRLVNRVTLHRLHEKRFVGSWNCLAAYDLMLITLQLVQEPEVRQSTGVDALN